MLSSVLICTVRLLEADELCREDSRGQDPVDHQGLAGGKLERTRREKKKEESIEDAYREELPEGRKKNRRE